MGQPWRPLLELLESFADLLAMARQTAAGPSRIEADVDPGAVEAAVERFRDALVDASEIELHSVRLYHRNRSGLITRVVPRRHATHAASHSDEATDLASEQLARMVDLTGEYFLGDPWELEPERVAGHWAEIADELASLEILEDSLGRLMTLVREEYLAAPAVPRSGRWSTATRMRSDPAVVGPRPGRGGTGIGSTCPSPGPWGRVSGARPIRSSSSPGAPECSVTKVAGLPYRAAGLPWPLTDDGRPMTFLAQFCFEESRDLVGKLPGDVLLIFAEDRQAVLRQPL